MAIGECSLVTSQEDRPTAVGVQHLHRGGLLVLMPADRHRPIPMTWLPDRQYRITFEPARNLWHLQAEDDLRWATAAWIVVTRSGTDYLDVAAAPDGMPVLCRHDNYLVRHQGNSACCRMTISTLGA